MIVWRFEFFKSFKGSCLNKKQTNTKTKKNKATLTPPKRTIFMVTRFKPPQIFTLKGCLLGGVKLAKNADPDKYLYNSYGTGLDGWLNG